MSEQSERTALSSGTNFVHLNSLSKTPDHGRGVSNDKLGRYGWAEVAGKRGKYEAIAKDALTVDNSYQRPQSVRRARDIAGAFDWRAFGSLLVSRRKIKRKTINYVLDGGHRLLAALMRPDVGQVPCLVFEGLTQDEEANIFVTANTKQRKPTPSDIFIARVAANDCIAQQLLKVFRDHGLVVKPTGDTVTPSTVKAVTAFYTLGPVVTAAVLDFCEAVFVNENGRKRDWTQGYVAEGIALFGELLHSQQRLTLGSSEVVERLSDRLPFDALMARAHTFRAVDPKMRRTTAVCRALVEAFNKHKQTRRLDPPAHN